METALIIALIIGNLLAFFIYALADEFHSGRLGRLVWAMTLLIPLSLLVATLIPFALLGVALLLSAAINFFFLITVFFEGSPGND